LWIGLSLGMFGICQTLVQATLPGPAVKRLGERGALVTGLTAGGLALIVMAFAKVGWIVFVIMPLFALTGIGTPALQTLATAKVDPARQGELQGVLASTVSLAFKPLLHRRKAMARRHLAQRRRPLRHRHPVGVVGRAPAEAELALPGQQGANRRLIRVAPAFDTALGIARRHPANGTEGSREIGVERTHLRQVLRTR
jgi:hypothetical protein